MHSHTEPGVPGLGQVLWQTKELICPVTGPAAESRYSLTFPHLEKSVQIELPACLWWGREREDGEQETWHLLF